MSPREKLQVAYELAFHPARLNAVWNDWDRGRVRDVAVLRETVDWALTLHQRLPEAPDVSMRALCRLARYQAHARAYRLPSMLRRFRAELNPPSVNPPSDLPEEVPAWMVRDIGLPVFGRSKDDGPGNQGQSPGQSPFITTGERRTGD